MRPPPDSRYRRLPDPFRVVRVVTEIFVEVAQHAAHRIGIILTAPLGC